MGRHSAPDDDEDGDLLIYSPVDSPVEDRPTPRGRHAHSDDDEASRPDVMTAPPVEAPAPDEAPGQARQQVLEQVPEQPTEQPEQVGKGDQPTAADLELLRTRPEVRNRVIAAVLAPFVVYTIVMVVAGSLGAYLLWVWLPLVTAGVLAGSILDAAHRKGRSSRGPAAPESGDAPESGNDEAGG